MLFRRWFGLPVAFVGAFCLAVMRWHLTFSRLAMHGITVPFFVLLVLYTLDRALTQKRLFDWALLGLALGFSLCFYTPLRILPPLIIGFLSMLAVAGWLTHKFRLSQTSAPALVLGLGCLIAVAPFAQYALRNPTAVFARTNEVSLFNVDKRLEKSLPQALWNQTSQHFLMFNLRGDNNGRHNLPGAPLLDPITGVLFLIGVALALKRCNQRTHALMLLTLIVMNLPGILSLEIEAPHALRSIGTLPAVLYFVCLSLACLNNRMQATRWPIRAAAIAMLCTIIGLYNYNWFFNVQTRDPQVQNAYSPAETLIAREADRMTATNNVILSDRFRYQPIAEFLIQDLSHVQSWNGNEPLALPQNRDRDLSIIVEPNLRDKLNPLQAACPRAILSPITSFIDSAPIAYVLMVPRQCA